jgi:DNA invertase Pin-like site-specific DNA recombinase
MLSLTTFADELEREKARQRTHDAMSRKARAGHVTGGRVFGYDNVEILDATGKRSHVERRINEAEAAVVRRIFELCAAGTGYARMSKLLNAEHASERTWSRLPVDASMGNPARVAVPMSLHICSLDSLAARSAVEASGDQPEPRP